MKRYILYILGSACIHALILYILYLLPSYAVLPNPGHTQHTVALEFTAQHTRPPNPEYALEKPAARNEQDIQPEPGKSRKPVSLARQKPFNKTAILDQPVNSGKKSPVFSKPILPPDQDQFSFMPDSILTGVNAAAQIQQELDRQYSGSSGVPVSGIISALAQTLSARKPAPVFDFIPSKSQAQALNTLINTKKGTQIDLYQAIDSAVPVTAETFNKELSMLVDKGFLTRKIVSPQHILMAFGVPVEMSKKNRANPVYEYTTRVSRTQIVTYLQARLFRLKQKAEAAGADSLAVQKQIRTIQDNIAILIQ